MRAARLPYARPKKRSSSCGRGSACRRLRPLRFLAPQTWNRIAGLTLPSKDAARSEAIRWRPARAALFARVKEAAGPRPPSLQRPGWRRDRRSAPWWRHGFRRWATGSAWPANLPECRPNSKRLPPLCRRTFNTSLPRSLKRRRHRCAAKEG